MGQEGLRLEKPYYPLLLSERQKEFLLQKDFSL